MKVKFYPMIATALMLSIMPYSRADKYIQMEMSDAGVAPVEMDVADISKIRFGTTSFNFELRDNSASDVYNYMQVKRIAIKDGRAAIENVNEAQSLVVMPNPVRDNLCLQGGNDMYGADVNIYSATGMHVMCVANWCGETLNVSHFAPGIYIINIQSVTLKFVKL